MFAFAPRGAPLVPPSPRSVRHWLILGFGCALMAFLLFRSLHLDDLRAALGVLRQTSWFWAIPVLFLFELAFLFRTWRYLFLCGRPASFLGAGWRADAMANLSGLVGPAGTCMVMRITFMAKYAQCSLGAQGAAVLVDRVLEWGSLLVLATCGLAFAGALGLFGRWSPALIGALVLGLVFIGWLIRTHWFQRKLGSKRGKLAKGLASVIENLKYSASPRIMLRGASLAALSLLLEYAACVLIVHALGLWGRLGLSGTLTWMAVVVLSFNIPLTPAAVGTHQLLTIRLMALFGVPASQALVLSIFHQGCGLLLMSGQGLLATGVTAWRLRFRARPAETGSTSGEARAAGSEGKMD